MASALDAVLGLIAQEKQQEQFKSQQITAAAQIFQQAREASQRNKLGQMQLMQDQPVRDAQVANLLSEAKARQGQEIIGNLLKGSQLKQAGRETRDKALLDAGNILIKSTFGLPASVNQYIGEAGNMMPPTSIVPESKSNLSLEQQSLERDEFGDKTAAALDAEKQIEIKMVKEKKKAEQESRTPQEKETADLQLTKLKQETTPEGKAQKREDDLLSLEQTEIVKGPAEGAVGKIALAQESLKNLDDIESILFKDGKFDRGIAARGNMPGVVLPFLGKITPRIAPDNPLDINPKENERAQAGQDYGRKIGAALAARQLIQTGVAARPEETQALYQQFAPNMFSNEKSAKAAIKELRDFYKGYLKTALPEQRLGKGNKELKTSFDSVAEAEKANLPKGTIITINGKKARVD